MLDTTFLLETDGRGWPVPLAAPVPEACEQANWLAGETLYDCATCPSPDGPLYGNGTDYNPDEAMYGSVALEESKHVIPVGSIAFVDRFLGGMGLEGLAAMNIPPELEQEEFLGRKIFRDVHKADVPELEAKYGPLLVKPGRRPKLFEAARSGDMAGVPSNEPLFVSQMLREPIRAEWRAFVLHWRVVYIGLYILVPWVCPGQALVERLAWLLFGYGAVALDVGVLEGGRTVVIECHPFISCGLYGFEGPDLLRMARAAWLAELRRQGHSF